MLGVSDVERWRSSWRHFDFDFGGKSFRHGCLSDLRYPLAYVLGCMLYVDRHVTRSS